MSRESQHLPYGYRQKEYFPSASPSRQLRSDKSIERKSKQARKESVLNVVRKNQASPTPYDINQPIYTSTSRLSLKEPAKLDQYKDNHPNSVINVVEHRIIIGGTAPSYGGVGYEQSVNQSKVTADGVSYQSSRLQDVPSAMRTSHRVQVPAFTSSQGNALNAAVMELNMSPQHTTTAAYLVPSRDIKSTSYRESANSNHTNKIEDSNLNVSRLSNNSINHIVKMVEEGEMKSKAYQQKIDSLQNRLDAYEVERKANVILTKFFSQLSGYFKVTPSSPDLELVQLKAKILEMLQQNKKYTAEMSMLKVRCEQQEFKLSSASQQQLQAQEQLIGYQKEVEKLKSGIRGFEKDNTDKTSESQKQIAKLNQQLTGYCHQIERLNQVVVKQHGFEQKAVLLQKQVGQLEQKLIRSQSQADGLRLQVVDNQALISKLQLQVVQAQTQSQGLRQQLFGSQRQTSKLKRASGQAQQIKQELVGYQQQVEVLRCQHNQSLKIKQSSIESLKRETQKQAVLQKEIQKLTSQLKNAQTEVDRLNDTEEELRKAKDELNISRTQLEKVKAEQVESQKEVERLRGQIESIMNNYRQMALQLEESRAGTESAKSDLLLARTELESTKFDYQTAKQQLQESLARMAVLKGESEALTQQVQSSKAQMAQLSQPDPRIHEYEMQIADLQTNINFLNTQIFITKDQLAIAQQEKIDAQTSKDQAIQKLEQQILQLGTEKAAAQQKQAANSQKINSTVKEIGAKLDVLMRRLDPSTGLSYTQSNTLINGTAELSSSLLNLNASFDQLDNVEKLGAKVDSVWELAQKLQVQHARLQGEQSRLTEQVSTLRKQRDSQAQQNAALKQKARQAETTEQNTSTLLKQTDLRLTEQQVLGLRSQLQNKQKQLHEAREELKSKFQEQFTLSAAPEDHNNFKKSSQSSAIQYVLENVIEVSNQHMERSMQQYSAVEGEKSMMVQVVDRCTQLQTQIDILKVDNNQLTAKAKANQGLITELKAKIATSNIEIQGLKNTIGRMQAQSEILMTSKYSNKNEQFLKSAPINLQSKPDEVVSSSISNLKKCEQCSEREAQLQKSLTQNKSYKQIATALEKENSQLTKQVEVYEKYFKLEGNTVTRSDEIRKQFQGIIKDIQSSCSSIQSNKDQANKDQVQAIAPVKQSSTVKSPKQSPNPSIVAPPAQSPNPSVVAAPPPPASKESSIKSGPVSTPVLPAPPITTTPSNLVVGTSPNNSKTPSEVVTRKFAQSEYQKEASVISGSRASHQSQHEKPAPSEIRTALNAQHNTVPAPEAPASIITPRPAPSTISVPPKSILQGATSTIQKPVTADPVINVDSLSERNRTSRNTYQSNLNTPTFQPQQRIVDFNHVTTSVSRNDVSSNSPRYILASRPSISSQPSKDQLIMQEPIANPAQSNSNIVNPVPTGSQISVSNPSLVIIQPAVPLQKSISVSALNTPVVNTPAVATPVETSSLSNRQATPPVSKFNPPPELNLHASHLKPPITSQSQPLNAYLPQVLAQVSTRTNIPSNPGTPTNSFINPYQLGQVGSPRSVVEQPPTSKAYDLFNSPNLPRTNSSRGDLCPAVCYTDRASSRQSSANRIQQNPLAPPTPVDKLGSVVVNPHPQIVGLCEQNPVQDSRPGSSRISYASQFNYNSNNRQPQKRAQSPASVYQSRASEPIKDSRNPGAFSFCNQSPNSPYYSQNINAQDVQLRSPSQSQHSGYNMQDSKSYMSIPNQTNMQRAGRSEIKQSANMPNSDQTFGPGHRSVLYLSPNDAQSTGPGLMLYQTQHMAKQKKQCC